MLLSPLPCSVALARERTESAFAGERTQVKGRCTQETKGIYRYVIRIYESSKLASYKSTTQITSASQQQLQRYLFKDTVYSSIRT